MEVLPIVQSNLFHLFWGIKANAIAITKNHDFVILVTFLRTFFSVDFDSVHVFLKQRVCYKYNISLLICQTSYRLFYDVVSQRIKAEWNLYAWVLIELLHFFVETRNQLIRLRDKHTREFHTRMFPERILILRCGLAGDFLRVSGFVSFVFRTNRLPSLCHFFVSLCGGVWFENVL